MSDLPLKERELLHAITTKKNIYKILVAYIGVVCFNALSVTLLMLLAAFRIIEVPLGVLAGFAVGTGGLGAGALAFQRPLRTLFPD